MPGFLNALHSGPPSFYQRQHSQDLAARHRSGNTLDPLAPGFAPCTLASPDTTGNDMETLGRKVEQLTGLVKSDIRFVLGELDAVKGQLQAQHPAPLRATTHGEKLAQAMKNPALAQIASGALCTNDMSLGEAYMAEAEAAEALGSELRKMAIVASPGLATVHAESHSRIDSRAVRRLVQPVLDHARLQEIQKDAVSSAKRATIVSNITKLGIDDAASKTAAQWQPLAVRQMPPLATTITTKIPAADATETFTSAFLNAKFQGEQFSPGFYWVPQSRLRDTCLPTRAYWLLEAATEPFLPIHPGAHGAKLTAFFNDALDAAAGAAPDEAAYASAPVFISKDTTGAAGAQYVYSGMYSQTRFSDKLDYDRMTEAVPAHVKQYWAEQLASPSRPAWVTAALKQHFWPRPSYEGPLPSDNDGDGEGHGAGTHGAPDMPTTTTSNNAKAPPAAAASPNPTAAPTRAKQRIERATRSLVSDLVEWDKQAQFRVGLIKASDVLAAFEQPDAAEEPGLRLWWEYLQCVGWDEKFYGMLVGMKRAGEGG